MSCSYFPSLSSGPEMMEALFNQTFSIGQSYPDPASLRSYSPPPPSFPGEGKICIEHRSLACIYRYSTMYT